MGERRWFGFYFIGLGEILVSCLHTLLRDQTPCSSLPKRFLWVSLFLILKMILKKRKEALKA